jgi:hypothetical protein
MGLQSTHVAGSVAHSWSLSGTESGNDVDPGNTVGVRLGTLLATSPNMSLRFALEVSRSDRNELEGLKIPGSNQTARHCHLATNASGRKSRYRSHL